MDNFTAIEVVEGIGVYDEDTVIEAWHHLIDTGLAWQLQGSFGRTARALIEHGICTN